MKTLTLTFLLTLFSPLAHAAPVLNMEQFLQQVERDNTNLKSAKQTSQGASLRSAEGDLFYSPVLFFEAMSLNDHRTNPMFPIYQKYRTDTYSLGLRQQTPIGLNGTVSYTLMNTDYVGLRNRFWEGSPKIELSQSLWRNAFGIETRAQQDIVESAALATQYNASYQVKLSRAEAEAAYVRLAVARELLDIQKSSYDRAIELLDWAKRRTQNGLGEQSDLFQAQANYESNKLSLKTSEEEEKSAARYFNRARNIDSDAVAEVLSLPRVVEVKLPKRAQLRDDVRAAQEDLKVTTAQARINSEKNKPNLEVFGQYSYNARTADATTAFQQGFEKNMPTAAVGVRFSAPLMFTGVSDAIRGYKKEALAAEALQSRKLLEQEIEWKDLSQKFEDLKKRYDTAEALVEIQKKKATHERNRLKSGRSTTYQTLIFEQDYNFAEAARVQAHAEILTLLSRLKTFSE